VTQVPPRCALGLHPFAFEGSGIRTLFGRPQRLCAACCRLYDFNRAGRLLEILHVSVPVPLPRLEDRPR
jgi:hypothetical protein